MLTGQQLLLLLVLGALLACNAQFGMGGQPPADEAKLVKEDLKYIQCEVCERVVDELYKQVGNARESAPNKKLDEITVIDIMEAVCNLKNESSSWLKKIDIVESISKGKKYIVLEEQEGQAKCKNECTTIAKSCEKLLEEDIDADDLTSMLYLNKTSLKAAKSAVCSDWTSRCSPRRTPLANSYKRIDEVFEALDEKDLEMEKMMASMASMGMGGQMYNADSLRGMMGGGGGMDEDDMDEDELAAMYEQYGGGGGGYGGMGGGDFDAAGDLGYDQPPGGNMEF